jgi:hypothetical protein
MNARPSFNGIVAALLIGAAGSLFVGCSSCKPGKSPGPPLSYDLKISPGESLKDSSLEVDVVGINPSDLERFKSYAVKKYFKPGDPFRADAARQTIKFVPGAQKAEVIAKTAAIWKTWEKAGAQYLVVLADIPGVSEEGKLGSQDPRRQLVPLCECYWPKKTKELEVKVQAGGVSVVTIPREGWSLPAW